MPQHGNRAQKKLVKKKAKRAERKVYLAQRATDWTTSVLKLATEWPVVEALIPSDLWDQGIGALIISRRMPDGRIALANFLVDTYCLGVKDAYYDLVTPIRYRTIVAKANHVGPLRPAAPELFAKLVTDAVAYARDLGFAPHSDYEEARLLLAGIDTSRCTELFEFGKDGKPLYIQGPNESLGRAMRIVDRVRAAGGHYVLALQGPADEADSDRADEMDEELDDEPTGADVTRPTPETSAGRLRGAGPSRGSRI